MIDWKLAPEDAVSIKMDMANHLYWVNNKNVYWDACGDGWSNCTHPLGWRTIATRPTQTKTVADAVEWHFKIYGTREWRGVPDGLCFKNGDWFFAYPANRDDVVCTREQFEAYVKEQEGEKWTHVYGPELKCRILAVDDEHAWILTESGSKFTEYTSSLKPIKPTISEADAVALAKFSKKSGNHVVVNAVADYLEDHDII